MLAYILWAIRDWKWHQAKIKAALSGIDRQGQGEYLALHRAWKGNRKRYRTAGGKQ